MRTKGMRRREGSLSPSQPEPGAGGQGPGGGQGRLPRRQAVQLTPAVGNRPRDGPSRRREEHQANRDEICPFPSAAEKPNSKDRKSTRLNSSHWS